MHSNNSHDHIIDPLLNTEEIVLATTKQGTNKVVFGVMLKFFEKELLFPSNTTRPSQELVMIICKQLLATKPPDTLLENYDWENRSVERFRQEIRNYFGFRLFDNADKNRLEAWLINQAFQDGMRFKKSKRKAFNFFKENKIELINSDKLDDYVRSNYIKFDNEFLNEVNLNSSNKTKLKLKQLIAQEDRSEEIKDDLVRLVDLKKDPPDISLKSILMEVDKLTLLQQIAVPVKFLSQCNPKLLKKYYLKIMRTFPSEIKKVPEKKRHALIAIFCYVAGQRITDNFNELLLQRIHLIETSAESHVEKKLLKRLIKTDGKMDILFNLANIAIESPMRTIEEAIYPSISQERLKSLVEELRSKGKWYGYQVKTKMRSLYTHYHRRLLLILIKNLDFKSSNPKYDTLLNAIQFIKQHSDDDDGKYYENDSEVPLDNVMSRDWEKLVFEEVELNGVEELKEEYDVYFLPDIPTDLIAYKNAYFFSREKLYEVNANGLLAEQELKDLKKFLMWINSIKKEEDIKISVSTKELQPFIISKIGKSPPNIKRTINRFYYELAVFDKFRKHLSCKNIWVDGARKYRDPNEDVPKDWDDRKPHYYKVLDQPETAKEFTAPIKKLLYESLAMLNNNIPDNKRVKLQKKGKDWRIKISPSLPQSVPKNLELLHREIEKRWQSISLLDMLKEVDLDVDFTDELLMDVDKQLMNKGTLRKRLLLVLYAIGTNMGLKSVYKGNPDVSYSELRYVKRSCTDNHGIRHAIAKVINQLLAIRDPSIWGTDTMSCICDSTLIRVMDQNFVAQWHPRYREKGIMIYWHVEKGSVCVYSQSKTCLSSEVGSMFEGILRHNTNMLLNNAYIDTHGQSLTGFGFGYLLNVSLLPRLKNIAKQTLYYVHEGDEKTFTNLALILEEPIDWDFIEEQYDEMIKQAVSLKLGLVDADVLMKRFSQDNYNNPVYKAFCELGKAIKTIFLCRYLACEELRIEIHESLNIVERVNGFMHFIFFGKLGTLFTNQKDEQEKIVLCLHLIEVCLAYVNTLMIQEVLSEPLWKNLLTAEDKRAITSLIHGHINPYGVFTLNMEERIAIKAVNKNEHSERVSQQLKILKNLLKEVE